MMVRNHEAERVNTVATDQDVAEALAALDLENMPAEKRHAAIMERLAVLMLAKTPPGPERDKLAYQSARRTFESRTGLVLP